MTDEKIKPVTHRYKYADGFWRTNNGEPVNGEYPIHSEPVYPESALAQAEEKGRQAGLREASKDAERYRWLRCGEEGIEFRDGDGAWRADGLHSEALDAAIDAAIKEQKK
jgi:hypothetical protein